MTINELKQFIDEFKNRWTIENVKNLTLPEIFGNLDVIGERNAKFLQSY